MTAALACLAALLASAGGAVARVDGVEITLPEVLERASELGGPRTASTRQQALESLVLDVLMSEEARRLGLADSPAVRERLSRERRRAAAAAMADKEAAALPPPAESDLRRLYHLTADSVRLRMLVFPSEDPARVAFAMVQRSGKLDDAARAAVPGFEPADASRPRIRGELDQRLADAAFRAPIGVPAGPVELENGWVIFVLQEREVGDEKGFAAQRPALEKFARAQTAEAMRRHVRERLRKEARITTDDAFLESIGSRRAPTSAELDHVVATVNGSKVRYRDIELTIRQLSAASGHAASAALRKQLLMREIEDRVVEDAAVARGFLAAPSVVEQARRTDRRVLAAALVDKVGASTPAPTEKEIVAFYKEKVAGTGQTLEGARGGIAQHLLDTRRGEALRARVESLRARAAVVVDAQALQAPAGT
jgi:hypothetical protein